MDVYKTNGSYEEYDREKLMRGIHEAYKSAGEVCPEAVVCQLSIICTYMTRLPARKFADRSRSH